MKILILVLLSIFIFSSCIDNNGSHSDSILKDTKSKCLGEYGNYKIKLRKCNLDEEERIKDVDKECFLYKETYKYSSQNLEDNRTCYDNIANLTCEELENNTKLDDIEGCPTFRDKPIKSKKEICSENYFFFCEKQLSRCGEASLDNKCEVAKYMTGGQDSYLSFKMSKMLEYCDSEGNENATVNDLDCILEGDAYLFECSWSFEDFRAGCTEYFD